MRPRAQARLIRLRPGAGAIDGRAVDALVEAVDSGQVVLMPTDTVYGLAATASRAGIESLARIKGRDAGKPVAVRMDNGQRIVEIWVLSPDEQAYLRERAKKQ